MSRYENLMDLALFCDLDNTQAFDPDNKEKMSEEWRAQLAALAKAQAGTRTAAIAADFLAAIKANGYKLSPKTEAKFRRRITEASQPK